MACARRAVAWHGFSVAAAAAAARARTVVLPLSVTLAIAVAEGVVELVPTAVDVIDAVMLDVTDGEPLRLGVSEPDGEADGDTLAVVLVLAVLDCARGGGEVVVGGWRREAACTHARFASTAPLTHRRHAGRQRGTRRGA